MNVPADIKQRVENKVKDCMDKASKYYNRTFDMPTIMYNLRGTTAGEAWYSYWMVKFQPGLLMDNLEHFIESTVPHEVAHLIDHVVNPENFQSDLTYDSRGRLRRTKRTMHGADFKFIMTHVLGAIDDTRCHSYDVSKYSKKKTEYVYRCTCGCNQTLTFGPKRHAKEQNRPGTYSMRGHGRAGLELVNTNKPTPVTTPIQPSSHNRPTQQTGSTKDIARRFFTTSKGRGDFINKCVAAGIKKTTASTYYQNFNSGMWK